MAAAGYVDIIHKATGQTSTVIASTVPAWESAGWTPVDNGNEGEGAISAPDSSLNEQPGTVAAVGDPSEE
jgi:hypothetical protein